MNLSPAGLDFIRQWEKFSAVPYQDSGGVWTQGYGATRGINYQPLDADTPPISLEEAEQLLQRDSESAVKAVNIGLTREVTQNQFNSLVSLAYNIGSGAFHGSTVLRQVNQGIDPSVSWASWDHVHGVVNAGLDRRRAAEIALFQS